MSDVRIPADVGTWSLVATYTGSWSVPGVPGAALDDHDNLLIVWADSNQSLVALYTKLDSAQPKPVTLLTGSVQGPPAAIYFHDTFYVFWRNGPTAQLTYAPLQVLAGNPPQLALGSPQPLSGAFSSDTPQVALGNDMIYVGWRGINTDEQLYFGTIDSAGNWSGGAPPFSKLISPSSPGFGLDAAGKIYIVYRATDSTLLSTSGQAGTGAPRAGGIPFNIPSAQPVNPAAGTLTTSNRPALAVIPTPGTGSGSLLVVFEPGTTFNYVLGQYSAGTITGWGNPSSFNVPSLSNLVAVLVNTAALSEAPYAILGNASAAETLDNVFYLYQYQNIDPQTIRYTRSNAWAHGGTFDNPDLLWYAKGVGRMQARSLSDPSGWWFFAAIHGEHIGNTISYPGWQFVPPPPLVPTSPLPSPSDQDTYWDQCQHQTWYFPPWHRAYLLALETQIRADVINLGGPVTWALPYWNYFGGDGQNSIPPAFTQATLPDGNPNPLFVTARYGAESTGTIVVLIPPTNQDCMSENTYTATSSVTPGFGGPNTGFLHAGSLNGELESNPHNFVHNFVGGTSSDGQTWGLMADPGLAALDPIFYLHHANIDRMWAVWNETLSNNNPTDTNWLNGPPAIGSRQFVMPFPSLRSSIVFSPTQVNSLAQLNYTYDDLEAPVTFTARAVLAQRLARLGATAAAEKVQEGATVTAAQNVELVGASQGPVAIKGSGTSAAVNLDIKVRRNVAASLASAPDTGQPDRVFLKLENVRGTREAVVLHVYVDPPGSATLSDRTQLVVGSVALFGLRNASLKDGRHGGQGLDFVLEVTNIFDALHVGNALDVDSLNVRIVPHRPLPEQADITVGRISIYRQGR